LATPAFAPACSDLPGELPLAVSFETPVRELADVLGVLHAHDVTNMSCPTAASATTRIHAAHSDHAGEHVRRPSRNQRTALGGESELLYRSGRT
jgi:hypothetical protein